MTYIHIYYKFIEHIISSWQVHQCMMNHESFYIKNHLSCNNVENRFLFALSTLIYRTRTLHIQIVYLSHNISHTLLLIGHDKKKEKEQKSMFWPFIYECYTYLLFRSNDSTLNHTFILHFFFSYCSVFCWINQATRIQSHAQIRTHRHTDRKRFNEASTKTLHYTIDYRCGGQIISLTEGCLIWSVKQICLMYNLK